MSDTVKWLFITFMFIMVTYLQYTADADKTASRAMKYSVENAVHDASLPLDQTQLSTGKLFIDPVKAKANFKASLMANLKLTETATDVFTPNANTFFKSNVKLVYFGVYNTCTKIAPCIINGVVGTGPGVGNTYNVIETLQNVGVVAIIETQSPRPFTVSTTLRKVAMYDYSNN